MSRQQLSLIGVGHMLPERYWRMKAHDHAFHEIIVVMAGIIHVEINGQEVAADSGKVLLYPAGIAHRERSDINDPFETYYISFRGTAPELSEFRMKQDTRHRIRQVMGWLFADRSPGEQWKQQQNQILLELIVQEFLAPDYNRAGYDLVAATRDVIVNNIAKPFSLDQLTKQAGLSKYHFVRKFKRLAGRTPMAETRALRADYARDLLLTTDLPLKEIAIKTGLGDEYALSRVFRIHFGLPPGAFRKRHEH